MVVATKWWPLLRTAGNIRRTIDARIRHLQGYSIGLYMVHQPFGLSSREAEMDAMADLVEAGKIRSVGVSNFNPAQMRRAHAALQRRGLPLAVNQVEYSLLDRRIERNGVLETARGTGRDHHCLHAAGIRAADGQVPQAARAAQEEAVLLARGWKRSLEKSRSMVTALENASARHYEATAAQVALNWVIHARGDIVVTIPGVTNAAQAAENAAAMSFQAIRG